MRKDDIYPIFVGSENEICQASCKFFYRHPEYLNTVEFQKLYDYAKKNQIRKIMSECPEMSREEAESVLHMRCVMSDKIRPSEVDSYKELVFAAAEMINK